MNVGMCMHKSRSRESRTQYQLLELELLVMNQLQGSCEFAFYPLREHQALLTAERISSTKCVLSKYVLVDYSRNVVRSEFP